VDFRTWLNLALGATQLARQIYPTEIFQCGVLNRCGPPPPAGGVASGVCGYDPDPFRHDVLQQCAFQPPARLPAHDTCQYDPFLADVLGQCGSPEVGGLPLTLRQGDEPVSWTPGPELARLRRAILKASPQIIYVDQDITLPEIPRGSGLSASEFVQCGLKNHCPPGGPNRFQALANGFRTASQAAGPVMQAAAFVVTVRVPAVATKPTVINLPGGYQGWFPPGEEGRLKFLLFEPETEGLSSPLLTKFEPYLFIPKPFPQLAGTPLGGANAADFRLEKFYWLDNIPRSAGVMVPPEGHIGDWKFLLGQKIRIEDHKLDILPFVQTVMETARMMWDVARAKWPGFFSSAGRLFRRK
jgi:hypothetical protein